MDGCWVITAEISGPARCPDCGVGAARRHSSYIRRLQDLPAQGTAVEIHLRMTRWHCRNGDCTRQTFAGQADDVVQSYARQTSRVAELARLIAHAVGGRPAERLMRRLGMVQGDDRLLRNLKRYAARRPCAAVRVAGIDDWSWQKGSRYGTIVVDLERRAVVDVLQDRSVTTTARWLAQHATVEVVSRDRCGLYAQAARQGAPRARQVADRFHLVQNLRYAIEQQLSRSQNLPSPARPAADQRDGRPLSEARQHQVLGRQGRRAVWLQRFGQVKRLQLMGAGLSAIVAKTGLNWRTVAKWAMRDVLPERRTMEPKPSSPIGFLRFLAERWAQGVRTGRHLLSELRQQGYTGSLSHLERLLCLWRRTGLPSAEQDSSNTSSTVASHEAVPDRIVPPIAASILCMKPRRLLTERQAQRVDWLKEHMPGVAVMRQLAMRFRGILRGRDINKLDAWMQDAHGSGLYGIRRFVQVLRRDIDAVRNAIRERWSNGQTEGHINRLKTLKRAMYGRAGTELLRARMLPLSP